MELSVPWGSRVYPVSVPAVVEAASPSGPLWKVVAPRLVRSPLSVPEYAAVRAVSWLKSDQVSPLRATALMQGFAAVSSPAAL
ncbi:hypothetical protein ACIOC1_34675 [Streptomyces sp. NPDC088197]|uniref:hypothetical protein n=1 Tax=Streptomyces sp. NPDC088197 TaxID=3365840 RepID=UPI0037FE58E4